MYCRNFFKFALVCSAFQMLFGLPVMANDFPGAKVESTKTVDPSDVSSTVTNREVENSDDDQVDISILLGDQPVKEVKLTVILDSKDAENTDDVKVMNAENIKSVDSETGSVNPESKSVSDGVLEQKLIDHFQTNKKSIILGLVQCFSGIKNLLKNNYSDGEIEKFLDRAKSWELRENLIRDNGQNLWQINFVSPGAVQNTNLLEKIPLDEKNNNFVEINLINK